MGENWEWNARKSSFSLGIEKNVFEKETVVQIPYLNQAKKLNIISATARKVKHHFVFSSYTWSND